MDQSKVRDWITRARVLARAPMARVPGAPLYRFVLDQLDEVERALQVDVRKAFESSRSLGVIAVRELDGADGDAGELERLISRIRDGLRQLAGLPYWA